MDKKVAKMVDVARLANVSTATVSRVLQQPKAVKKETRERVLDAIKLLDYQPNILARQFRTKVTKSILVIIPNIMNNVYPQYLAGIDDIATKHGYKVLLGNTDYKESKVHEFIEHFKQQQVDGMILLTSKVNKSDLFELVNNYPVVLTSDYVNDVDIPIVSINNVKSALKATQHLINLNHKRIAHISGPLYMLLSKDRLLGYQQALINNQLPLDESLIKEGDFSYESGYEMMSELIKVKDPPTAVFSANDVMAMGVIRALNENGLSVPDDVAIVGFDNIKFSSIIQPALTTIAQPFFEMGQKAMELLIKRMNGEVLENSPYIFDAELVIRDSCSDRKQ